MSILDKSTATQLQSGLRKDMNMQQQGDVTFALNAIRDAHDGGKYDYQSEPGNELVQGLPSGYSFIGSINGDDNKVYIFATNSAGSGTIGTFKEGFYSENVRANFNWDLNHPITGEFRVKNGCENIIYWCNGDTWDGFFNFDRPELFQDDLGSWVINKFKFVPDVIPPKINIKSVNDSGGFLPLGSYYFQGEYLDESLNSIYKTDISPQTIIYDDSLGENYNQIDGGLNILQFTEEIGGVPITSKSITLTLSNLDSQFAFIRINVARQITNSESIDAHAVAQLIPISGDTIEWTYQGYNVSSGDYPVDYSEMITDNIRYETAYVMEQVQGRLIRARLKQGVRDYSSYQATASAIAVTWDAKEVPADDVTQEGDPKNPKTYWLNTTFQGDEIYALGVRYLHNDGTWSPVFHIPGRPANVTDLELLTVVDNTQIILLSNEVWQSNVDHLGLEVGDQIERWKVFNTAFGTNSQQIVHPFTYEGELGYYETDVTYPEIRDCNGDLIWGSDSSDVLITTDTKIRHHRMPDRKLLPHHTDDGALQFTVPIALRFSNIVYPNSDITGHQFCHVKRGDFNKTVLDSGYFCKRFDNNTISIDGSGDPISGLQVDFLELSVSAPLGGAMTTGRFGGYNSANITYNKNLFTPTYLKFNKAIRYDIVSTAPRRSFNILGGGTIDIEYSNLLKTDEADLKRENFKVLNQVFLEPKAYIISGFPIRVTNTDFASPYSVMEVSYELENINSTLLGNTPAGFTDNSYVYKKTNIQPYDNLFNLDYKYINFNYNDSLLPTDNIYYNGDTLIVKNTVTRVLEQADYYIDPVAHTRYEEQHINTSLRYSGTGEGNDYYKDDGDYNWLLFKISRLDNNGEYDIMPLDERYPEFYAYNKDYNKQTIENYKSVLPITYNYCSECLGTFDNKLIFSPKSFDEESFDLYRINKVNDSITIPAHRGAITGLKYQNDYLLVHTENSLFILQPNPQSLATDISSVYLTTGGFLSLPPNEIVQNDMGYGGMQHKQHMCETPFGHAWCDQKRGQIFLFDTKMTELTNDNSGMSQWFKEELPSALEKEFYQKIQLDYPYKSTYNVAKDGIGIIMYYDPRFKRLIISKRDYKPVNLVSEGYVIGATIFNLDDGRWYYINGSGVPVLTNFSNIDYFENKSWTISYAFDTQNFVSWHSYRPVAAFSDNIHYYTLTSTSLVPNVIRQVYRHKHFGNYQNYYGIKYYFIVEWMTSDFSTDDFDSIHYNGYALQWDATNKQWKTVTSTFDYAHVYSFDQSSNVVPLTLLNQHTNPYGNITSSNTQKYVIKTDNNYKISGLYDLATNSPVTTSDWTFLKNFGSYIDKLVYATNHDNTKSAYTAGNIKDKFVYCRLFYLPPQDYKKVINLLQTNESRSIR